MAKSIKKNFAFNFIYTVSGLLFPLITFPYASRVMLADGIGQVQFFTSIITYVSLFSCLGIPTYAIREIARCRDDKSGLNKTSLEILLLHAILTFCGYIVIAFICLFVDRVQEDIPLFLLLSSSIFLTAIGCEWFFKGIEDFKYITIRSLAVKVFSVIYLFVCVKSRADIMQYALYTIMVTVGSNIINLWILRKHLTYSREIVSSLNPWKHLKPALQIFVLNIVISIYVNLDTVMLGFIQDDKAVGFYTAATRISHIFMMIVSSLGGVLLPRLSNLVKSGDFESFKNLSQKAMDFVVFISTPVTFGLIALAPVLVHIFSGYTYEPAILTLQIIAPTVLIIGLSQVMGMQILYPLGKEKLVILSTSAGAIINLVFNFILIKMWSQDGAAVATILAETTVTITMAIIGRKYIPCSLLKFRYIKYIIASVVMFMVCYYFVSFNLKDIVSLFVVPSVGAIVYVGFMLLVRDSYFMSLLKSLVHFMHKQ